MESINANQSSSMIQKSLLESLSNTSGHNKAFGLGKKAGDDCGAYMVASNMGRMAGFETFFDKFATFQDTISTTQNTFDKMREQGESILALINRARSGNESDEELAAIDAEVNKLIASINDAYNGTRFNGINPFSEPFGLEIPNWQNMFGVQGTEESAEKEIAEMLAEVSVNFDFDGVFGNNTAFGMSGSAEIKIGYTEDGALQITVDASMNFDLSGISQYGVQSDESLDIINNFLDMLGIQQGRLGDASNFMNAVFEQIFGNLGGFGPGVSFNSGDGVSSTSGEITQHASITLDGAYQMPNIAINIL